MKIATFSDGFSVLMAVYKGDDLILFKKAVKSIIDNKLRPSQFVLVADGPLQEEMFDFIKKITSEIDFLDVLFLNKNQGLVNALNQGLNMIKYPWVVRADADDINLPERFLVLANAVQNQPDLDLIGSAIVELDRDGNEIFIKAVPEKYSDIVKYLPYRNPFNHMSVAFRLEKVLYLGGYPNIYQKEDYALWVLMISKGAKVCNVNNVLVRATAGEDMYKRRSGFRSVFSEFHLQKLLVKCGFQVTLVAIFIGVARSLILILPNRLRAFIYENFLRKRHV